MEKQSFSRKSYVKLIQTILSKGFLFVDLESFDPDSANKQVILRHDVDYSPQKALELAKIDRSVGVSSIFFFLVRGHWYNFFGHYTQQAVREIQAMGFPIGLHYAPPPEIDNTLEAQHNQLLMDFSLMSSEFPSVYPAFSWHVPPPLVLHEGEFKAPDGLLDMYSERFFSQAKYVSDSSLRNSYEYLMQIFISGEFKVVQLVLHPVCWIASRPMNNVIEMLGEIVRSSISEGELDFREKIDYLNIFPSGLPSNCLNQIGDLFVNALKKGSRMQKKR